MSYVLNLNYKHFNEQRLDWKNSYDINTVKLLPNQEYYLQSFLQILYIIYCF